MYRRAAFVDRDDADGKLARAVDEHIDQLKLLGEARPGLGLEHQMGRISGVFLIERQLGNFEILEHLLSILADGQGERAFTQFQRVELLAGFENLPGGLVFGVKVLVDQFPIFEFVIGPAFHDAVPERFSIQCDADAAVRIGLALK